MQKFVALYMAPVAEMDKMMQEATPEDKKKGMAEWMEWLEANKAHIVDTGAALGKNKRVTKDAVTDMRNEVGGFMVLQADSHEEAAKLLQGGPHFEIPGAYIDVLTWVDMENMAS